ncbi:MAG: ABC transporter ATP-binding protein [Marinibacterium sp.]
MNEPVLALSDVDKGYNPGQPNAVQVLSGLNLELFAGEAVALVAPSGAGKSTLLHIAGLLDAPDSGEVRICGQNATSLDDAARTAIRRRDVGFVYQFHHLLPEFSALENILLPQLANGESDQSARRRAAQLLGSVGLKARADHRPAALSGGEQQRVALCRGLANRPRLLLADEPTGNLDPGTADQVFDLLMGLVSGSGLTALIATHNPDLAARMDRTVYLVDGGIRSLP